MKLEDYARLQAKEMTDTERKIMELEAQIWEDDKNDPAWVRRQNREHNNAIFMEIDRLRQTTPSPGDGAKEDENEDD